MESTNNLLKCCSCKKWYDPSKVPETQIGFCSDGCLRWYLREIDEWFEDIKAQYRARSSTG